MKKVIRNNNATYVRVETCDKDNNKQIEILEVPTDGTCVISEGVCFTGGDKGTWEDYRGNN